MKEKLESAAYTVAGLTAVAAALPSQAFAAAKPFDCSQIQQFNVACILNVDNFGKILSSLINILFVVAVIAALFYLIYGGIKWLISEGDKTAVQSAREHIIASIIGLIIVFLSYFIVSLILYFLTGQSLSAIELPRLTPL